MSAISDTITSGFIKLNQLINQADRIVLTSHEQVDGDGLGSMLALHHHLTERGKQVLCFSIDFAPGGYHFLPGVDSVVSEPEKVDHHQPELVIFLDVGNLSRSHLVDHLERRRQHGLKAVSIDHHPPEHAGPHQHLVHLTIIDPAMSATAQLVYHFLAHHRHPVSKEIATCLLTGILTDTSNFSNQATTHSCLAVAGKLLLAGANLHQITDQVVRNQSVSSLKLWGRALSRLTQDPKTVITSTAITLRDLAECGADADDADGIANFLNNLQGARAVVVYREQSDGTVRASLRTTRNDVDVGKLAAQHGGGGHAKAAGFTAKGTLVLTEHGWRVQETVVG